MNPPLRVLFQDNHLLVVNKPAGMLVQGDRTRDPSLLDLVREHRKSTENKPGNVYVGLVHRLDRPVSGIVIYAKTSKAASRLSEQFRACSLKKEYQACCLLKPGVPVDQRVGEWTDLLKKDELTNIVRIVASDGLQAVTHADVVRTTGQYVLLKLRPETGRPHQLRVQTCSRGLPILGDRKYGGPVPKNWPAGTIALHASRIEFEHPTKEEMVVVESKIPEDWPV